MMSNDGPAPPHADNDSTSGCSADGSNTDSGRGGSEEGDIHAAVQHSTMPTPAHYGMNTKGMRNSVC